jgi:hypothetical protein
MGNFEMSVMKLGGLGDRDFISANDPKITESLLHGEVVILPIQVKFITCRPHRKKIRGWKKKARIAHEKKVLADWKKTVKESMN